MKGYEKLEQHLMHQGKVVGFYEDIVKLPSGKVVTWDLVKHKGAAAVVPVIFKYACIRPSCAGRRYNGLHTTAF